MITVGRRHHEIEQHERRPDLIDLLKCFGARSDRDIRQVSGDKRLAENVAAHRIVVHHQDETL